MPDLQNQIGFAVQNSGNDYSFSIKENDYRFELRAGDHWSGDAESKKERSEIGFLEKLSFGVEHNFEYEFKIEAGEKNIGWTAISQIHNTEDADDATVGPPFELALRGERLVVLSRYDTSAVTSLTSPVATTLYESSVDITREQWHSVKMSFVFDPFGGGRIVVSLDNVVIVDYTGPAGYNDAEGGYFKVGLYRSTSQSTIAMDVRNFAASLDSDQTLQIKGTSSPDYLFGHSAAENLSGGSGNDHIYGGAGADRLDGGSGDDWLWAGAGSDKIAGGSGADTFRFEAGDGKDWISDYNFADGDRIELANGQTYSLSYVAGRTIIDLAGADQLSLEATTQVLINDRTYQYDGKNFIDISNDASTMPSRGGLPGYIYGTASADVLSGGGGDDSIYGGAGADRLSGGNGNDWLSGGAGEDKLYGGGGGDRFYLEAGSGNDWAADYSFSDGDKVELPAGTDFGLSYSGRRITVDIGSGDRLTVESATKIAVGSSVFEFDGRSFIELSDARTKTGTGAGDHLYGTAGADTLSGGGGNDTLYGGAGADRLSGGSGGDWLWGGAGDDKLTGGSGADIFHIEAGDGTDWVGDYKFSDGDRIELAPNAAFTLSYSGARTIIDLGGGDQLSLGNTTVVQIGNNTYQYNGHDFDLL